MYQFGKYKLFFKVMKTEVQRELSEKTCNFIGIFNRRFLPVVFSSVTVKRPLL